ncbi:MAG TPA: biotin--[acetyl-CoA-carboxylase] ligase [Terriglobales bacterium]|nr:biotin--[acetyl-CoA-carboxylase] ligase [Terriglobales bacterium]
MHPPTDARLSRIVRLLMDHATVVVSGTKIAQEIGTTRSEVWRLVQQLRGLGVDIAGHSASGYRLRKVPDLLLGETLAPMLRGTIFGDHIHHYFRIGSTNVTAMEAAATGAPEGSVFMAEEQVAGRGRGAHGWHSARSQGIYCSVVLRPVLAPADVLVITLAMGLAACTAVEQLLARHPAGEEESGPPQVDLRWPNDLLLNGKKFVGILTELTAEATCVRHMVAGIGINVNQPSFPTELRDLATSLRLETGNSWSRVELAAALLKSLDREYRALVKPGPGGRESVLRRFQERSSYAQGRRVRVEEDGGYEGVTAGLDARGFLRVETTRGLRTVLSGGVREVK